MSRAAPSRPMTLPSFVTLVRLASTQTRPPPFRTSWVSNDGATSWPARTASSRACASRAPPGGSRAKMDVPSSSSTR